MKDFYSVEDYKGRTGEPGQVRSYDMGYITTANAEVEAKEMGLSLEEYLEMLWDEASYDAPWVWETLGSGYGHHGDILFRKPYDGGELRCKEIFDQIMFDVYPPSEGSSAAALKMKESHKVTVAESDIRSLVAESVKRVLREVSVSANGMLKR